MKTVELSRRELLALAGPGLFVFLPADPAAAQQGYPADFNAYLRVGIRVTNSCTAGCGSSAYAYSAALLLEQAKGPLFGGPRYSAREDREEIAAAFLPFLRGRMATVRPSIGRFDDSDEVLEFVNAQDAEALAGAGPSCPDHFERTRFKPLFLGWDR